MRFIVQVKPQNGDWKDAKSFASERQAKQSALQMMKNKRGSVEHGWLRTRVITKGDSGGKQ